MASLLYQSLQPGLDEDLYGSENFAAAAAAGLNSADESLPYSTSELNAPEYSTDDFRMYQFKVARCSKRYVHDWRACPFAHPTENARRRDPRLVKYLPVPCPDYKRGICLRGDSCSYSHGVYECWLHPAKYRTQLCKEGPNCRRPVCFFAHSVLDLRQPSHMAHAAANGSGGASANMGPPASTSPVESTQGSAAPSSAGTPSNPSQLSSAAAAAAFKRMSPTSDDMLNNMQGGVSGSGGSAFAHPHAQYNGGMGMGRSGSTRASGEIPQAAVAAALAAQQAVSAAAALLAQSPGGSRHSSSGSLNRASSVGNRAGGSSGNSPERSGSPNTPSQARLGDAPAQRSATLPGGMSDAAAALAVLTQQQQQVQAQQAAAQQQQAQRQAQQVQAQQQAHAQQAAAVLAARLSMDAAAARSGSLDAAAAAATTQAMLQAGGGAGLPPRMSLDSLLATRTAAPAPTAAAALAGGAALPLNEQPFPQGNAPRMSNAVARKLGLAPQRSSLDARLTKLRGAATPPRSSLDGILHALQQSHSARSSLDQQQAMLQAMAAGHNPQLQAMAGLNGMGPGSGGGAPHMAPHHGMNGNGGGGYPPVYPVAPAPHGNGYGSHHAHNGMAAGPGPNDMALHPALLSLVAAQMAPHQMTGMAPGVPNGMHSGLGAQQGGDANMAALMESLHSWQLNGGLNNNGGGGGVAMQHHGGGAPMHGFRASMDSMSGMQHMNHGGPNGSAGNNYYEAKGIWGQQEAINNQAGNDS